MGLDGVLSNPVGRLCGLMLVLAGCSGDKDSGDREPNLLLEDANNYTFTGALTLPDLPVKPLTDLHIDWSALNQDIQCHDLDPTSIRTAAMLRFQDLNHEDTTTKINNDTLKQSDLSDYVDYSNPGGTDMMLSQMTFFGTVVNPQDYIVVGNGSLVLILSTGEELGTGIRSVTFITPTEGSENTEVIMPDPCGALDYEVDLHSLSALAAPGDDYLLADWSKLTVDSRGNLFNPSVIDQVLVAHYDSLTATDLETQFLDVEQLADGFWSMTVANATQADLSGLSGSTAFPGFSSDGLWLLGLSCTTCANPAPRFLTVIQGN